MTTGPMGVGILWAFHRASVLESLTLLLYVGLILLVLPAGWLAIKRRYGLGAAGPLWPLVLFMLLASIYALATPPWQTPDEPRHMGYVELVRRAGVSIPARISKGEPLTGEQRAILDEVNRDVLTSLRSVDLWPRDAQAVIDSGDIPGPVELSHPPLYYRIAAVVTGPMSGAPILARLAVLRAFGVMIAGWIVWLCGRAARLLWPARPRLAETPMAVATGVPTFAAFAGTVNSDVLANLVGAAFLVVAVRVVVARTKRDPFWLAALVALAFVGVVSKRSFLPLVPMVGVALLVRREWSMRKVLGAVAALQVVVAIVLLSAPMRPAAWSSVVGEEEVGCDGGRIGDSSLCHVQSGVSQSMTVAALDEVEGKSVSVGFWARSDQPAKITVFLGETPTEQVVAGVGTWNFGRVVFGSPPGLREVRISLVSNLPAQVDGVVFAKGRFSEKAPMYADDGTIRWDGRRVENLLTNGSAEDLMVGTPSWLPSNVRRTLDGAVDAVYAVTSGEQPPGTWSYIWGRLGDTFGIFWGSMGWDQPPRLLPVPVRWLLAAIVGLGLLGAALGGTRLGRQVWPGRAAATMIAAVLLGIFAVVVRGIPPTDRELLSGRYLFPSMVAISAVLVAGWRWLLSIDDRLFRATVRWFVVATHLAFIFFVFIPFRWQ